MGVKFTNLSDEQFQKLKERFRGRVIEWMGDVLSDVDGSCFYEDDEEWLIKTLNVKNIDEVENEYISDFYIVAQEIVNEIIEKGSK